MKVVIIGGVAGGASTAARLRRLDEKAEIIVFEKGNYISYANCGLPYYIGNVITNRNRLFIETPQSFKSRFNIDVRVEQEVTDIDAANKYVIVQNLNTKEIYRESYDKLVLSSGAFPYIPDIKGIKNEITFTVRNVSDTDAVKAFIENRQVKNAVVVGSGFVGLEMVENLNYQGIDVTLVEIDKQVMPTMDFTMAKLIHKELANNNINILLERHIIEYQHSENGLRLILNNGEIIETELVILAIGIKPDAELAKKSGLEIGTLGGIKVNQYLQTSNSDIYAIGDAIEMNNIVTNTPMLLPLAGPANKQGRIAANNIAMGNVEEFTGGIGNCITKVFDLTVSKAGVSAKMLRNNNIAYISSYTHSPSHATYYPDAAALTMKIIFSPDTGQLFGAQIIGNEGVDKRIEMLAQVIQQKGSIYDLCRLEHAYAPPYSSAKDPVNMAGFVANNILSGKMKIVHWKDLQENDFILDVRTTQEYKQENIKNAVNIPLDEIRGHLNGIPKDKRIIVYCGIGLRAYFACCILSQLGYNQVYNLSGGYKTYKMAML